MNSIETFQADELILRAIPDHFQVSFNDPIFKAVEEDGKRFIYMEAHDESLDLENERVMLKALMEQKDYYLQKGNIDLGHFSKLPPNKDRPNPRYYEIGQPVEVDFDTRKRSTLVKGLIYQNNDLSDWFWQTTRMTPAMKWYPSIGGHTVQKSIEEIDGKRMGIVKKLIWSNIGLTQEPINQGVPPMRTIPFGLFVKSLTGGMMIEKAMDTTTAAPLMREDLEGDAKIPENDEEWIEHYKKHKDQFSKMLMGEPYNMKKDAADKAVKYFYSQKLKSN